MNLGLHIIKNPNNTYSFVGNVPIALGYIMSDGSTPSAEYVKEQHMLPSSHRTIKTRVFNCRLTALAFAKDLGFKVAD